MVSPDTEFTIEIGAPAARVWRALTDLHELRRWRAPQLVHFNARPGGTWFLARSGGLTSEVETGEVLVAEPPLRLRHTWATTRLAGHTAETEFTLTPSADGASALVRVAVADFGFSSFPPRVANLFLHELHRVRPKMLARLKRWCEEGFETVA
ncbi:MAG: SRPBCC domain-containing protein [Planctomycetes bacterium]|nr:SRPBCC domain-containing protein [Planctomycetota bacterium]